MIFRNQSDIPIYCSRNISYDFFSKMFNVERVEQVVLLNMFVTTVIKQHLFKMRYFCSILNVLTVTFDQFNASLLNKSIIIFFYLPDPKLSIYLYLYLYIYIYIYKECAQQCKVLFDSCMHLYSWYDDYARQKCSPPKYFANIGFWHFLLVKKKEKKSTLLTFLRWMPSRIWSKSALRPPPVTGGLLFWSTFFSCAPSRIWPRSADLPPSTSPESPSGSGGGAGGGGPGGGGGAALIEDGGGGGGAIGDKEAGWGGGGGGGAEPGPLLGGGGGGAAIPGREGGGGGAEMGTLEGGGGGGAPRPLEGGGGGGAELWGGGGGGGPPLEGGGGGAAERQQKSVTVNLLKNRLMLNSWAEYVLKQKRWPWKICSQ